MIIEFVGIPGSGKTTLCSMALNKPVPNQRFLSSQIVRSQYVSGHPPSILSKSAALFNTLVTYRMFFLSGVYRIWRGPRRWKDKLATIKLFSVTLDNYAYLTKRNAINEWVILDEGITQRIFTVMIEAQNRIPRYMIESYALAMPKPDIVIYLKLEPRIAAERMQKRQTAIVPRLQGLSTAELIFVLQEAQDMFDALIECLSTITNGSITIIELNAGDLDFAFNQLNQWIDVHLLDQSY